MAELKTLEEQREKEVLLGYKRIEELWPSILSEECSDDATREWMLEAEKLVEMFRETRNLFLTSRVRVASYIPYWSIDCGSTMTFGACSLGGDSSARMGQRKKEWRRGWNLLVCLALLSHAFLWLIYVERDKHLRKSKDDRQQPGMVDSFRGVTFENWLRIFTQVR